MAVNNFCEACGKAGLSSKMSPMQLNMEEALLICDNTECVFPLGTAREEAFIVSRKAEELSNSKRKRKKWTTNENIQPTQPSCDKVIHWQNVDALCWLDSSLSLLVHNNTIKQLLSRVQTSANSLLKCLVDQYAKAQYLSEFDLINAKKVLEDVRSLVWTFLCPKMKCTLGVNDSPLFALPLLLRENAITADRCIQEYMCEFSCQICEHTETTRHRKHVVTFPNTPKNFTLQEASFHRSCNKCNAKNQYSRIIHERAPDVLFFHFVEGLNSTDYLDYQFDHEGCSYHLTQFIQYMQDPDHFICWTKQDDGSKWLDLDDLKPSIHCWSNIPPKVPPSQVHIIVLQKVSPTTNNNKSSLDQELQHVNTNQIDIAVCGQPHAETSLHNTKMHDSAMQEIVCELENKLAIDSHDTPSDSSFVDCKSNRLPLKNLNNTNSKAHLPSVSTVNKCVNGRLQSSTVHSSFRVTLKRLSGDIQFQPLLPKKRRTLLNPFQPYVPKKERSCLIEACAVLVEEKSPVSLAGMVDSDSGYSSPSSVSSCTSSLSKDESIADQLEKLLPDCLEHAAPIKDLSVNQDDFIQQLLFND